MVLALVPFLADGQDLPDWAVLPSWAEPVPPAVEAATESIAEYTEAPLSEAVVSIAEYTAQPAWFDASDMLAGMMIRAGVRYVPSPRVSLPAGVLLRLAGDDPDRIEEAWRFYQQARDRARLYPQGQR